MGRFHLHWVWVSGEVSRRNGHFEGVPSYLRRSDLTELAKDKQTVKDIFDAFREGDPKATTVIGEASHHLAAGIGGQFNPEVVILGGGLYGSAAILLFAIELTITVCKLTPMRPGFRFSWLGD
jgi:predicted NBD/HSP70 family sugar kinase